MKYVRPLNLFREVMKAKGAERGRLLGLDVGEKYIGLAISDVHNRVAAPLSVLLRKKSNMDLMAIDFNTVISELSISGFIIGYPFDRTVNSTNGVQVKVLIDDLYRTRKLEGLRYTFVDEAFTSKTVDVLLNPLKMHHVREKTTVDKFAAVGILQGYLDLMNKKCMLETDALEECHKVLK